MHDDRVFPFEKVSRLESPERRLRQPPEPIADLVASKSCARVLDVGTGTGYFAIPILVKVPSVRVVGVDQEPRMLEVARKRAEESGVADRLETVVVPRDSVSLPDASVDFALLANVYHELTDRVAYLRDVYRVLSPGGTVLICDWDPLGSSESGPPLDHRVGKETVQAELATAGFTGTRSHSRYEHHYVIESARP